MAKKTVIDLSLADDLDAVRTLYRLGQRQQARRDLNDLEDKVKRGHAKKVLKGILSKMVDVKKALPDNLDND